MGIRGPGFQSPKTLVIGKMTRFGVEESGREEKKWVEGTHRILHPRMVGRDMMLFVGHEEDSRGRDGYERESLCTSGTIIRGNYRLFDL